ncbi:hypothetical protein [Actinoplanes philippinensis]|uniref:hypothetical protein n=1 Tax=Actinoplanes philippinensis TaxID=35752 RepID=UPI000B859897|nr:hypothetical protein [Actinoplanes philippinensis]
MDAPRIAAQLPPIAELRARCRAIALLDHIVGGGRWDRYTFAGGWAQMDDNSGNEWEVVFPEAGAFIRVFDHESDMSPYLDDDLESWPGLVDGLPEEFRELLEHDMFTEEGRFIATAVLWRRHGDDRWHTGASLRIPDGAIDGSDMLEILLDGTTDRFVAFASTYYGRTVDRAAVEHVVEGRPVTAEVVRALNPDFDPAALDDVAAAS